MPTKGDGHRQPRKTRAQQREHALLGDVRLHLLLPRHHPLHRNSRVGLVYRLPRRPHQPHRIAHRAQFIRHLPDAFPLPAVAKIDHRQKFPLQGLVAGIARHPYNLQVFESGFAETSAHRHLSGEEFLHEDLVYHRHGLGAVISRASMARPARIGICMVLKKSGPTLMVYTLPYPLIPPETMA